MLRSSKPPLAALCEAKAKPITDAAIHVQRMIFQRIGNLLW